MKNKIYNSGTQKLERKWKRRLINILRHFRLKLFLSNATYTLSFKKLKIWQLQRNKRQTGSWVSFMGVRVMWELWSKTWLARWMSELRWYRKHALTSNLAKKKQLKCLTNSKAILPSFLKLSVATRWRFGIYKRNFQQNFKVSSVSSWTPTKNS